jgi:hypothetical protein
MCRQAPSNTQCHVIPRPRHRRPTEIQSQPIARAQRLDAVGVQKLVKVPDRGDGGRNVDARTESGRDLGNHRRRHQGFVTLQIHDHVLRGQSSQSRHFGDPIGAGGMPDIGHDTFGSEGQGGTANPFIVGGHDHRGRTARLGLPPHPLEQRLAGHLHQRLARQSRRAIACRYDDVKHDASGDSQRPKIGSSAASTRASSGNITGMPSRTA